MTSVSLRGLRSLMLTLALFIIPGLLTACDTNSDLSRESAVKFLRDNGFTRLADLITTAGLEGTLDAATTLTLFAPTNAAFDAIPADELAEVASDLDLLRTVLRYHLVNNKLLAAAVLESDTLTALAGGILDISVVDTVAYINASRITSTNLEAPFGVVHTIDAVLPPQLDNIVEALAGEEDFSTLVTAVTTAELVDTLSGPGPFTVFAPSNSAFAALPAGALDDLLADPEALANVLTLHVIPGRVWAHQLSEGLEVEAVNGDTLVFTLEGGAQVNGIRIVETNYNATNGVVHVIDGVLLPNV